MTTVDEVADILERAADGFESGQYGWCRERLQRKNEDGGWSYCILGAVRTASGKNHNACFVAERTLSLSIEASVAHWNDHLANGVDEVVERMKRAAKELRNGEMDLPRPLNWI